MQEDANLQKHRWENLKSNTVPLINWYFNDDFCLMECDTMQSGRSQQAFQRIQLPPSSG